MFWKSASLAVLFALSTMSCRHLGADGKSTESKDPIEESQKKAPEAAESKEGAPKTIEEGTGKEEVKKDEAQPGASEGKSEAAPETNSSESGTPSGHEE
jgi:hypothetical protein